jgi:hypothetical protein
MRLPAPFDEIELPGSNLMSWKALSVSVVEAFQLEQISPGLNRYFPGWFE